MPPTMTIEHDGGSELWIEPTTAAVTTAVVATAAAVPHPLE